MNDAMKKSGMGFSGGGMPRKVVDYSAGLVKMLENRLWQRDKRDIPLIQPDSTFYNEVVPPLGLLDTPVNAVTTKFVRAISNKNRCSIFCTSWVPDGRRVICGSHSGEFTLWHGINLTFENSLQAHDTPVRSMRWSHNGVWMVTTDDRGFVKYWQSNLNNVHTFQAHSDSIRCSSFSPTDSKLATCSLDGTVRIFDFIRCSEEYILRGHGGDVMSVDWHPRKNLLVSGSKDNQQPVKLWDPKAGQSISTIHAHKAAVMSVQWNRNGNWLLTGSRDHLIKVFDIRMMKEMYTLKAHRKDVNVLAWHPVHETLFASGGSDGAILFWEVGNEKEIGGMEAAHDSYVWSLSWHPLGHFLVSGSNDTTSKFWCRNRPGDEMKDGYNSLVSALVMTAEESEEYSLPALPLSGGHMTQRGKSDAVILPPPLSDQRRSLGNYPPSSGAPNLAASNAPGSQGGGSGLAVLGADIIAETFGDKKSDNTQALKGGPFPPSSNSQQSQPGPPFFAHEQGQPSAQFHPPHQGRGPPPTDHPTSPGAPPNQFRPPPNFQDRGGPGRDFGRPDFRSPPGPSPFSWQRADYRQRRPSHEEEGHRHFPPPRNPYVYRRQENEPPRDARDPRMMSGDPRRAPQGRRPEWGHNPEAPPTSGPPPPPHAGWQDGGPNQQGPPMHPPGEDRPRGPPDMRQGPPNRRTLLEPPAPPRGEGNWSPMDRRPPPQFPDQGPPREGPPPGDHRAPPEHRPPPSRTDPRGDPRSQQRPQEHDSFSRPPNLPPRSDPSQPRPGGEFIRPSPQHDMPPSERYFQNHPDGPMRQPHTPTTPPAQDQRFQPPQTGRPTRPPFGMRAQNRPNYPPEGEFRSRGPPPFRGQRPPFQPRTGSDRPPHMPSPDPRLPPQEHAGGGAQRDSHERPPRPGPPHEQQRDTPPDQQIPPRPGRSHEQHRGGPPDQQIPPRPGPSHEQHRGGPPDQQIPPRPGPPHEQHRGTPPDQHMPPRPGPGPPHEQHRGTPPDQHMPPRPGPPHEQHRGTPPDQQIPPRPGPPHEQHRGGPPDQHMPPRPGPPHEQHRGGPPDQHMPPRPGPQHRDQQMPPRGDPRAPPFHQNPHDYRGPPGEHYGDRGPPPVHFRQHGPPRHEGWKSRDPRSMRDPRDRGHDGNQVPPMKRPRISQD